MRFSFCKKSVFSILFLVSFFLGTICGVLLFQSVLHAQPGWIRTYCSALTDASLPALWLRALFAAIPFLLIFLLGCFPFGVKVLPIVIALRGCLLAYFLASCYTFGLQSGWYLWRSVLLMPLYYVFCQRLWIGAGVQNDR